MRNLGMHDARVFKDSLEKKRTAIYIPSVSFLWLFSWQLLYYGLSKCFSLVWLVDYQYIYLKKKKTNIILWHHSQEIEGEGEWGSFITGKPENWTEYICNNTIPLSGYLTYKAIRTCKIWHGIFTLLYWELNLSWDGLTDL